MAEVKERIATDINPVIAGPLVSYWHHRQRSLSANVCSFSIDRADP